MRLTDIETPALVLDRPKLVANLERMRARMSRLGVMFRPHLKTAKSIDIARLAVDPAVPGTCVTVSTLREADYFAAHGYRNILYAVGIVPSKIAHVARIARGGVDIAVILDSLEAARGVADAAKAAGIRVPVLIEIDSDGVRAGVKPDDPLLIEIGRTLAASSSTELRGVLTHAGGSYGCRTVEAIADFAEQERAATVGAAERLRAAGLRVPVVSVGSTPTASFARSLDGVTEVRAGVYMFQDLVMANLGVCAPQDIAISVLTEVIGHRRDTGAIITDSGWMAVSRDRGTQTQAVDLGYGLIADLAGSVLSDTIVTAASQEHGVLGHRDGSPLKLADFPIGRRLRVLPNHACATAAQHERYLVTDGSDEIVAEWPRFNGW